jgi:cyclic pyranopterin phosphate synthase
MVALRGINDDEISDFAALTYAYPFHIRFIEYMPIGTPELTISQDLLTPEIKQRISALGKLIPVDPGSDDGPARRFRLLGALGEIGFISPVSNHFCQTCNRIRLTANGRLRPCLLSDETIDVAGPLRNGCSDEVLYDLFRAAAQRKHEKHKIGNGDKVMTRMASIGG